MVMQRAGSFRSPSIQEHSMAAYAVAHLHDVDVGPDIVAYLEEIDSTLAPFGGRFLIHGAEPDVLEGHWSGDLIVVAFPDMERARSWYASPAYQAILPLRLRNSRGTVVLVDGVSEPHRALDVFGRA
jgi:uncharacterized protein (DUF1330 family)